jgi:uncharacterized protein
MSREEIRLEILKLLRLPDLASPDIAKAVERAQALEAYVMGAGQAIEPPRQPTLQLPLQARTNQQSPGPARK